MTAANMAANAARVAAIEAVQNWRNDDKYYREYFADKMHGFGLYHFSNGHCYEGSCHEEQRQGLGVYTFESGNTSSGSWNSGVLKISLSKSVNDIQCMIKAARKATQNAILIPRVEEEVRKAGLLQTWQQTPLEWLRSKLCRPGGVQGSLISLCRFTPGKPFQVVVLVSD